VGIQRKVQALEAPTSLHLNRRLALVSFFSPPKYIYTTEKQKEIHEELSDVGETTFQLGQQQAGDLRPQESAVSKRYAPMDQGLALIISESIDAPVVLWGPQI
jgi:hypothetical protein